MFISQLQIVNDPELPQRIKQWVANLNNNAKKSGAPKFKVAGPCDLLVRLRASGGAGRPSQQNYTFMGGEELMLSSITMNRIIERDGIELVVVFTPTLAKASEFSTLTLKLDKAIELIEGFESWTKVAEVDPEAEAREAEKKRQKELDARIPTVEEVRSSEVWGQW